MTPPHLPPPSQVSQQMEIWNYNKDPATGTRFEAIDHGQVDFVYRHDPGWYLHSYAGCVYHVMRIIRAIAVPASTPAVFGFTVVHDNGVQTAAWYRQVYKRWFANWNIPERVVRILYDQTLGSEHGLQISTKFLRGVFLARQVQAGGGTAEQAGRALLDSLRTPVGRVDARWNLGIALEERDHFVWDMLPAPGPVLSLRLSQCEVNVRQQTAEMLAQNGAQEQLPRRRNRAVGPPGPVYGSHQWHREEARRWQQDRVQFGCPSPAEFLRTQDIRQECQSGLDFELSHVDEEDRDEALERAEFGAFVRTSPPPSDSGYESVGNCAPTAVMVAPEDVEELGDKDDPLGLGPETEDDTWWRDFHSS